MTVDAALTVVALRVFLQTTGEKRSSQSSEFVHAPVTLLHGSVDPDTPMRVNLERSWVVMIVDAKSGQGHDGNSTLLDEVNSTVLRRY